MIRLTFDVIISAAFTLFFAGGLLLLALETWLLATGQPPITWHVRREVALYPHVMFAIAGGLIFAGGALFAHFFWSGAGGGY